MGLKKSLLHRSLLWLYCWLRTLVYWLGKVSGNSSVRLHRWLLKGRNKRYVLKLGQRMYELYQEEQRDWPEDARVKEIVATLEESGRKAQELKSRLQERDDRYRANVQSFKQKASLRKTKSEEEVEAD
jgi:hypothetical protein